MPKESINIIFRVSLPPRRFRWTDQEGEKWTRDLTRDGAWDRATEPPWLLHEPGQNASPDTERVVNYSSAKLYRDFLSLAKHTRSTKEALGEAVVRFADRYGFLGEPFSLLRPETPAPGSLATSRAFLLAAPAQAEPLRFWGREVQTFYELDDLAQLLYAKDIDALHKRIVWDREREEVRYVHDGNFRWTRKPIATKERHSVRYERLQTAQAFDRTWTYLSLELNKRLTSPLAVAVPSDPRRPAVAYPRALLDALYFRLYAKAANIEWQSLCDWCGAPLPLDATARRRFCETTECKNHWHNRERGIKRAQMRSGTTD
jgi:hypothetical protein